MMTNEERIKQAVDLLDRKLGKDGRLRDQAISVLVLLAAAAAFLLSGAV